MEDVLNEIKKKYEIKDFKQKEIGQRVFRIFDIANDSITLEDVITDFIFLFQDQGWILEKKVDISECILFRQVESNQSLFLTMAKLRHINVLITMLK